MLGKLSAKYESSGDPGSISTGYGDAGGVSYGAYQFASNMGVVDNFVQWLLTKCPEYGKLFIGKYVNSEDFKSTWKYLAQTDYDFFFTLQHDYVKELYYDRAVQKLKDEIGFDITARSNTLNDVLWSRSVQYHPKWMPELFTDAAELIGKSVEECTDEELIYNIYEVNLTDMSWTSGSPSLRPGLFNRFRNEREDALNMLKEGK